MAQEAPMRTCPMAAMCKGMVQSPVSRLMMMIPGAVFVAVGILIAIWPSVLPWLVAVACVLAGAAMLFMVNLMRGMGTRLEHTQD